MFVKICGITSSSDALTAARAGTNAIGLNFYPESPRHVTPQAAQEILQHLPPFVDPVALFVNSAPAEIRDVVHALGIRTVQLHGDLTPELISELGELSVLASFPLRDEKSMEAALRFIDKCERLGRVPSALLVDSHVPGQFGGTGQQAPWALARSLVAQCPVPVALAGGLTPRNVAEAIRSVRPWGVDVASGVEVAPGRKEPFKIRQFIEQARQAAQR